MLKKKVILTISLILIILIIGVFSFVKFGGYFIMEDTIKKKFFADIESSPQLSERFYEIYNVMKPNSLNPTSWLHFINHQADPSDEGKSCACADAFYAGVYLLYTKTKERIPIINMLESNFSQKKCLDYYIKKSIEDNKIEIRNLNSLSDSEIIYLLLQIQNPSYYNKKRYPERVESEINNILNNLN